MLCSLFSFDIGSSFQDQIVQEVAACSIHDDRNSFEVYYNIFSRALLTLSSFC